MKEDVLNTKVPKGTKLAVVGDIHEHDIQLRKLIERISPSEKIWLYSLGDIRNKGYGPKIATEITNQFRTFTEKKIGGMILGNYELKALLQANRTHKMNNEFRWLETQPLVRSFVFSNESRVTIMHGGVTPSHKWADLNLDVETSFIRDINDRGKSIKIIRVPRPDGTKEIRPAEPGGKSWHEMYDGRFGYIVAGHHAQKDGKPKFYNYSCNIDTACYLTGVLTCQIFDESGKVELIQIEGPTKKS